MSRIRPRRRRVWLRFGVCMLAFLVVCAAVWVVGFSPALETQQVRVTGLRDLTRKSVTQEAGVPLHRPLVRVDIGAVRQRVEDLDAVESVRVSRSWPDTVTVAVTERTPLYRINESGGPDLLVDHAGVTFATGGTKHQDLPVAAVDPDQPKLLSELGTVIDALPEKLRASVRQVDADSRDTIELKLTKNRTVIWGNADDSELKAKVATALLKRKASVYNVSAPGYPTTK